MERHHMKMAVSVFTRSDHDALSNVADRTRTAYNDKRQRTDYKDKRQRSVDLGAAGFAPARVARRIHTLVLTGSLDRGSVHQLETEIERLCEEGVTGITLDLRGLTYIDAIGVAVIGFRCGLCRRRGYDFALIRGPRLVQRAFEQAGVSELLPFSDGRRPLPERVSPARELAPGAPGSPPALVLAPPLETVASGDRH
jgi:anti-anti-sigma factor